MHLLDGRGGTRQPGLPLSRPGHPHILSRLELAGRLGDPLPALVADLPPGDGLVAADELDLPQPAAMAVHHPLSLDYSAGGRGLGDLPLDTGLLDENEFRWPG